MATATENEPLSTPAPADPMLMLCRCVDFITGEATPTFLANPAAQDDVFARARGVVEGRSGHWDIQWHDEAVPSGWLRFGLSFTVGNVPNSSVVIGPVALFKGCPSCEVRRRYDRSTCEAAAKLKHAGLEYLATDMDWAQAATQYSGPPSELIQFVEALARESDYDAVQEMVNQFYGEQECEADRT